MSVAAQAPLPGLADLRRVLWSPAAVLLVGLAVLGVAFTTEATAAWQIWSESTAYSHCFFVLPIALYLLWERRADIIATRVEAMPWVGLLALPTGVAWLVAERLGIMEGRQLMAVSMVELLFLAVLGWRMCWAMSGGLLYLYFLVPFGAFLSPILQDWTAVFSGIGLTVLGIPHYMDGYLIEIPEGRFYVAEACAGFRFLIASIAFGVLYAQLMYRDYGRRAGFMLASIIVPIIANWFRALGIVVLGHVIGSAEAAAADHIIYGWIFFSAVTLVLTVAGLPFRQDLAPPPPPSGAVAPAPRSLVPAAVLVVLLAAIAPGIAAGFNAAASAPLVAPAFAWNTPLGCRAEPARPGPVPGSESVRFACPQGRLTATAQVFSPRTTWAAIGVARLGATGEIGAEDISTGSIETGPGLPEWRYTLATGKPDGSTLAATLLWTEAGPARGGLAGRIRLARTSIIGGDHPPVLLSVTFNTPRAKLFVAEEGQHKLFLTTFLRVQTGLEKEMARLSRVR